MRIEKDHKWYEFKDTDQLVHFWKTRDDYVLVYAGIVDNGPSGKVFTDQGKLVAMFKLPDIVV